jgi:hypothetical protein
MSFLRNAEKADARRQPMSDVDMKTSVPEGESGAEMRPEYDFSGGVRGKYYERARKASNVVVLDPDIAEHFRDSESVNQALRMLISIAEQNVHP